MKVVKLVRNEDLVLPIQGSEAPNRRVPKAIRVTVVSVERRENRLDDEVWLGVDALETNDLHASQATVKIVFPQSVGGQ